MLKIIRKNSKREIKLRYEKIGYLLTKAERSFYGVLSKAISEEYEITSKVRISDILKVKKGLNRKDAFTLQAKINQKHIDFIICKKDTMEVACCVELNDSSHNRKDRIKRDNFVREACKVADMPLIEILASRTYNINEIRQEIALALEKKNLSEK